MSKTELFVGNLDQNIQRIDIENVFEKYGKILRCDIKNKGMGPSFCFLEFEDEKIAEDAMNGENGKELNGNQIRVDYAKSRDNSGGGFRGGRGGGGFRGGNRDFGNRDRFGGDNNFGRRDDRGGDDRGGRGGYRGGGGGYRGGESRGGGGGFRGGRGGGGGGGRGCFQCGQEGHFARECPTGSGGGGGGYASNN